MGITQVVSQLEKTLGEETANALVVACMKAAGVESFETPQDVLRFAEALAKQGGFIEVFARSLKANALNRGATLAA
jgi:hypothetical protein